MTKSIIRFAAALALTVTAAAASAQSWPQKPVTIIAAFPPGGGADSIARLMAPKLSQLLDQPVIVDNKPGASGNIATEYVARSQPDGHTLLLNNNTLTINTALGLRQSFNPQKDLKFIAAVASTPIVIAVHPSLPVKTVEEFADYARREGDKLSFSSCGNGTAQHFIGERFSQVAKAKMVHVPYKGCGPAIVDGLSGVVPVLFNTVPNLDAHVQAGRLRYIAVAAQRRLPFKPDLPTVSESRDFAGFEAEVWFGFIGPTGMPADVARRLEQVVLTAMRDETLQKEFANRLISTRVLDSAEFDRQISSDLDTWKRLAEELKIKLN